MRIGIDARMYGIEHRGIGRYVQALVHELEEVSRDDDFFIFLQPEMVKDVIFGNKHFHGVAINVPLYSAKEQLIFPKLLRNYALDIVHFPHWNIPILYRGTSIITIHDLILDAVPDIRRQATTLSLPKFWLKFAFYKFNNSINFKRALCVIAITESTKRDIMKYYKIAGNKITVIHNGLQPLPQSQDKATLSRYNITVPYLFYVGALYPHKNIARYLQSFSFIRKQEKISFVLAGKNDSYWKQIREYAKTHQLEKDVLFLPQMTDSELASLYRHASVYVLPSLYEGFGLTALEAIACGTPVLASNTSCLPEVLNASALYCDPYSVDDMAAKTLELLRNNSLRMQLQKNGEKQLQQYSWKNSAQQTYSLYHSLS